MGNARLQHDAAFAMAQALVDIVAPCIREEERREAFEEFYHVCHAGIEAFVIQCNRQEARIRPSKN